VNRDALVVGINRYPSLKTSPTDTGQHLQTAATDAEKIAQQLENYGHFRVRRLPETSTSPLRVDEQALLTSLELERAIAQLFNPRTPNPPETALLYFAGHGLRKESGGITEGFLATSDSCPRKGMWGVSLKWLHELLQKSPIRQLIVWLDCCHAGEFVNCSSPHLRTSYSQQHFFISAARDFETAYSNLQSPHGALTEVLLKGINPCHYPDGVVSHLNLGRFVEQKLTGTPQQPVILSCSQEIVLTCTPENKHRLYSIPPKEPAPPTPAVPPHAVQNSATVENKLYNALLSLDYIRQESLFQEFVQNNQIGACLIHGKQQYGQRWLLHRLLRAIPHNNTASLTKKISFLRQVQNGSLDALWGEVKRKLKLKCQPLPDELAKAVCNLWQTQTVVLIFDDADQIEEAHLEKFIKDFWQPLVEIANNKPPKSRNSRLLVFLIDFDGCTPKWSIPFADALDTTWKPHIPLKLPPIKPLREMELAYWLEKAFNDLPRQLTDSIEATVQSILENSDNGLDNDLHEFGLHELAMAHICELCDQDWDEINKTRYV
jgi:hypothetical protein